MQPWSNSGHMIGMAVSWVVGLALLIGILWFLLAMSTRLTKRDDSPESILKRRYAAGEISSEEYTQRLVRAALEVEA